MTRRLVYIHKEGEKDEASNNVTIMVASIFAKLLGGFLEGNLSNRLKHTIKELHHKLDLEHTTTLWNMYFA
jgi:hypothetical protein